MDDDIQITWLGITAIIFGILMFLAIKEYFEPWFMEELCKVFICK